MSLIRNCVMGCSNQEAPKAAICCERLTKGLAGLSSFALFIIACIGAAGILPGSTMGWLAVGLGGGSFIATLVSESEHKKVQLLIETILAITFVTLGSLGVSGILSAQQVGWGITGGYLPFIAIAIPISCCIVAYRIQQTPALGPFAVVQNPPASQNAGA